MKSKFKSSTKREDKMKERISNLEVQKLEMIQVEERKLRFKKSLKINKSCKRYETPLEKPT